MRIFSRTLVLASLVFGPAQVAGAFETFQVGPAVSVGLAQPWLLGIDARILEVAGVGINYGTFTKHIEAKYPVDVTLQTLDVRGRWFPFAGSFFVGAGLGQRSIDAESKYVGSYAKADQKLDINVVAKLKVRSTYLSPYMGFEWLWPLGIMLGMDIGYQFVMQGSYSLTAEADDPLVNEAVKATNSYREFEKEANDVAKVMSKMDLPQITLLKLGWLF